MKDGEDMGRVNLGSGNLGGVNLVPGNHVSIHQHSNRRPGRVSGAFS
jgi:hypothetical protein